MRDHRAALAQMRLIGSRVTPVPWNYLNGARPGQVYAQARRHARLMAVLQPWAR
jgi:hypothetical protein